MTALQFYEILGNIEEAAVKAAEKPYRTNNRLRIKYFVAAAACFVIIAIGVNLIGSNLLIPNPPNDESSDMGNAAEQKDVNIYYINGEELAYKTEYLECSPEIVFESWKNANNIGEDVKLIKVEIKSNGQESVNPTDSSVEGYSVGNQFVMEVTLTQSIREYYSVKPEDELMESLRLTLTGYIYIDCDEFHVFYE